MPSFSSVSGWRRARPTGSRHIAHAIRDRTKHHARVPSYVFVILQKYSTDKKRACWGVISPHWATPQDLQPPTSAGAAVMSWGLQDQGRGVRSNGPKLSGSFHSVQSSSLGRRQSLPPIAHCLLSSHPLAQYCAPQRQLRPLFRRAHTRLLRLLFLLCRTSARQAT